ncbi:proteoglycan 4-like isoform X3 [Amblyraja radiata]|uniref:proteoglycan 4-like isoform X3 n=1 Tax=Amblyraja radiata TaxID=386614 RepID=UPI001401D896|nr:proteoglycan 4-like isoform X3 [Amblyraja radiata]
MPSHGKLVVPDGLKTLLEALGRAVVQDQPDNIQTFASSYFIELLQFREGNPTLDICDLVKMFHMSRGIQKPEQTVDDGSCQLNSSSKDEVTTPPPTEEKTADSTPHCHLAQASSKEAADAKAHSAEEDLVASCPEEKNAEGKDKQLPCMVDKGFKLVYGRIDELGTKMDDLIGSIKNLADVMSKEQTADEKQQRKADSTPEGTCPSKSPEATPAAAKSPEPTPTAKSPETTSPGTKSPEATVPGAASPGKKSPEATTPGAASPGKKSPEATPGAASPGTKTPEATSPEGKSPEATMPGEKTPEATSPGEKTPEADPETTSPEAKTPEPEVEAEAEAVESKEE